MHDRDSNELARRLRRIHCIWVMYLTSSSIAYELRQLLAFLVEEGKNKKNDSITMHVCEDTVYRFIPNGVSVHIFLFVFFVFSVDKFTWLSVLDERAEIAISEYATCRTSSSKRKTIFSLGLFCLCFFPLRRRCSRSDSFRFWKTMPLRVAPCAFTLFHLLASEIALNSTETDIKLFLLVYRSLHVLSTCVWFLWPICFCKRQISAISLKWFAKDDWSFNLNLFKRFLIEC